MEWVISHLLCTHHLWNHNLHQGCCHCWDNCGWASPNSSLRSYRRYNTINHHVCNRSFWQSYQASCSSSFCKFGSTLVGVAQRIWHLTTCAYLSGGAFCLNPPFFGSILKFELELVDIGLRGLTHAWLKKFKLAKRFGGPSKENPDFYMCPKWWSSFRSSICQINCQVQTQTWPCK